MPLATLLKELGVKASAEEVFLIIHRALELPIVTLSDLTEAIVVKLCPGPNRVISEGSNQISSTAARRIIELLIAENVLTVQGRLVRPTAKLPRPAGWENPAVPKAAR